MRARAILLLSAILLVAIALAAAFGSTRLDLGSATARTILVDIRLPRVLLAAAIGATLAVAGLTFQTLLRNPLADPFILGVSGGAACGAAVTTALGLGRVPGVVQLVAFLGAIAATDAVFAPGIDPRVIPVDQDIFQRPGPRVVQAARMLNFILDR